MFALKTAWRFIVRSPIQNIIILLTVIIGVGVQFFVISLGGILEAIILQQTTDYQEQLVISQISPDYELRDQIVDENPEITLALYSKQFLGSIKHNGETTAFLIFGVDNQTNGQYQDFYGLNVEKHLKSGTINDPLKNEIMLDDYFAKKNNIVANDVITFVNNKNQTIDLTVTGTFDLGTYRSVRNFAYISLELLDALSSDQPYTMIFQIQNPMEVDTTVHKLSIYFSEENTIKTWKTVYPELEVLNLAQMAVILVIEIFISIAVFVVILSVLTFSIQQKYKQLGILKAIGSTNTDITKTFTLQTALLSVTGIIIGLIAGTITMIIYRNYMVYPDGSPRFVVNFYWYNYFIIVVIILSTVFVATVTAIHKVKKLPIIELIKI